MKKTERRACILNSIVMYINSLPKSKERTDLLHLMEELEKASATNTFNGRMALLCSIGTNTEDVIEAIKQKLDIDLIDLRK